MEELIKFVENNSWFEWEEGNECFATRRHGDILKEEAGDRDYQEALRIKKLLKEKFPQYRYVEVTEVDEWIIIIIE